MPLKLALVGNPNSGKTTLFNILTGSNQTIGNWPGVTVEKKEGRLVSDKSVFICDLPGVYSLSPYTSEEIIVKQYLENERPDLIINIIDASNLERNLYLTTQITELGIPTIIVLNMIDIVKKRGDLINVSILSETLGCKAVEISAAQKTGIDSLIKSITDRRNFKIQKSSIFKYNKNVEKALSDIMKIAGCTDESLRRWYSIKLFERDADVYRKLKISKSSRSTIERIIKRTELSEDDASENIITTQRYDFIDKLCKICKVSSRKSKKSITDRIDNVVTNKFLAYPVFIIVMTIIYSLSLGSFSRSASAFISDGIFGDGWHFLGIGAKEYENALNNYNDSQSIIYEFENCSDNKTIYIFDSDGKTVKKIAATFDDYQKALNVLPPNPEEYGLWVPGIKKSVNILLSKINCSEAISNMITDGIISGVGSVLGFIPQMLILFICLAFLEGCGYMSRIAFITDRILSCFGLSGKSFIPIIIGTGCGVPGIMSSRTIDSESDKIITIATTTFMPCSAKLPLIALIAGSFFDGALWVAPCVYIISILSVMMSGIILKKNKHFSGSRTPFIMEMPPYHLPKASMIYRNVKVRILSFIKKAGTIIVLASIVVWMLSNYKICSDGILKCGIHESMLACTGKFIAPIFSPLGWGKWQFAVSSLSGIVAKENIVSTLSILLSNNNAGGAITQMLDQRSACSFMIFNVLCAPCLAAIAAIFHEMHSIRRGVFAVCYQCCFAYVAAFLVYRLSVFTLLFFILILYISVIMQKKGTSA